MTDWSLGLIITWKSPNFFLLPGGRGERRRKEKERQEAGAGNSRCVKSKDQFHWFLQQNWKLAKEARHDCSGLMIMLKLSWMCTCTKLVGLLQIFMGEIWENHFKGGKKGKKRYRAWERQKAFGERKADKVFCSRWSVTLFFNWHWIPAITRAYLAGWLAAPRVKTVEKK